MTRLAPTVFMLLVEEEAPVEALYLKSARRLLCRGGARGRNPSWRLPVDDTAISDDGERTSPLLKDYYSSSIVVHLSSIKKKLRLRS
jgi:hypothetical protein